MSNKTVISLTTTITEVKPKAETEERPKCFGDYYNPKFSDSQQTICATSCPHNRYCHLKKICVFGRRLAKTFREQALAAGFIDPDDPRLTDETLTITPDYGLTASQKATKG